MNQFSGAVNHLVDEDGAEGDALGVTLSLADTLEEDHERCQDVIGTLAEFEEGQGAEKLETSAPS